MPSTILIIEDNKLFLETIADTLFSHAYSTIAMQKGEEAVSFYSKNYMDVDLVIRELSIHGKDGERVFNAIKAINPEVKVILTSGHWEEDEVDDFFLRGAEVLLQKPFRMEELERVVEGLWGRDELIYLT